MGTELSLTAATKTTEVVQKPQLVLEIDGVARRFGLGAIRKYVRIGDPGLVIGDDWVIGGFNDVNNQLDAITLDGTTTTIAQQLLQDKGGTSSVSGISVALIDVDGEITKLITPGEIVDDVLGRKASVYLGYQNTAFPQDFIQIFAGVIDEIAAGATIVLNIAHPEQKKRGQVLPKITTELTSALKFRSAKIQGILFKTRRDVVGTVTISSTNTATAGSETVNVAATNITVGIQAGVSTASQVRNAIEGSIAALGLVELSVLDGNAIQSVHSTALGSDTTINVIETKGLILPVPSEGLRTYVRIGDEIIEYTGLTDTQITGCTREAMVDVDPRAFGEHHDEGDSVESFYRIQGTALDIALKIMMSGGPEYFAENVQIKSINDVEEVGVLDNVLYFEGINVADKYGLTAGDKVTVTGDITPANNVTDAEISQVVTTRLGSYIVIDQVLSTDASSEGSASFKTKWNVWPENAGLGLGGDEVDVPRFEELRAQFSSSFLTYDCYIRDTVEVKNFVDTEILFPTGAFTLPRKGKISAGFTAPPIGGVDLIALDMSNTIKPEQNKIYRGIARYFYNNIVFKYNENLLDDGKFLSGDLTVDADSKARIKVGNKTFVVEAKHLRPSDETDLILQRLSARFLDRYKFAAERIKIQAFYGKAFNRDVGDIVAFGGADFKLPSADTADRETPVKLYEVVNKVLDIKSGVVTLDLVNTAFSVEGARYGVISPASLTDGGSTLDRIRLKNSFGNEPPLKERAKWELFIGQKVLIHDDAWSYQYERELAGFDPTNGNVMIVDPPLPILVDADAVVEVVHYPDNDQIQDSQIYKGQFVFTNPSVAVVSGADGTHFDVGAGDVGLFQIGQPVFFHKDNADGTYNQTAGETKIKSVAGTTIELEDDLGLTLDNTWTVELIGFPDGGFPYRFL